MDAVNHAAIGEACAPVAERAERHFSESELIFATSPRAATRTPRIMAAGYRLILTQLLERGWQAPRSPVKLRRSRLIWILMRCFIP